MEKYPLVTVGIPTYNRPQLLQNAIECIAKQDYPNIELIISDNATPGDEVTKVVESFRSRIQNIRFVKRAENVGMKRNSFELRDLASGKYFMWLADDDEITSNYISSLVKVLGEHTDAACAMGNRIQVLDDDQRKARRTSSFPQDTAFKRVLHFVWRTDDAFSYGLHQTSKIKKVTIPEYWWPNKNALENTAYLFLIEIVLDGKVLLAEDPSVQWINKHYTRKFYKKTQPLLEVLFYTVVRRINVHYLYWKKIRRSLGSRVIPLFVFVSFFSLITEYAYQAGNLVNKFLKKNKDNEFWWYDKTI